MDIISRNYKAASASISQDGDGQVMVDFLDKKAEVSSSVPISSMVLSFLFDVMRAIDTLIKPGRKIADLDLYWRRWQAN